ncbi:glycosyltransferase family 2 protein [Rhizobium sp. AQ_MP]|jgi:glycosyltransferase involved in cell wall biosynthesis|uniref:glycosyltransferase family 2 protein n=1 Tax=Rhizobium sp. AQ_MP TaxID=2761536 RepID=UPI00163AAC69|nr:glycosyltransferase family A protein [Rhizobium sp. AQ_MP]MBC2774685.1 glycosyltransferase family 2 protein [Rhizobium sp. AQ_MP]
MNTVPVSVIVPTFRDGEALRRALRSIAAQTSLPKEVIVVDDAAGDESCTDLAAHFAMLPLTIIVLKRNGGPGRARNVGMQAASGTHIAFLDADDEWHPEKLSRQTVAMETGGLAMSSHLKLFSGQDWEELGEDVPTVGFSRWDILLKNPASISTVMIRRDVICWSFPEWYAGEDYGFVASHLLTCAPAARIKLALARADKPAFGASGLSARMLRMQIGEMRAHYFLWKQGLIGSFQLVMLAPWTWIKFARRMAIRTFRSLGARFGSE